MTDESGNREPLIIPAPVLVEVDYWVHVRLHAGVFVSFLDDIVAGADRVEELRPEDYRRLRQRCDRDADADMGFADAAVLAIVARLDEQKLATLDHRQTPRRRSRPARAVRLPQLSASGPDRRRLSNICNSRWMNAPHA